MKSNFIWFLLINSFSLSLSAQIDQYNFSRELTGIKNQWHKVIITDDIHGKVLPNYADLRVLGVKKNGDTIEAPYILRESKGAHRRNDKAFKILNSSYDDNGFYFTLEVPTVEDINHIKLDFENQNFDWNLRLEGSQNQQEWFTILQNYRILSIGNDEIDFQFTKMVFPDSKYRFFRIFISTDEKPKLTSAQVTWLENTDGILRTYQQKNTSVREISESRTTEIGIELEQPVPISRIRINVQDTVDYYRKVSILYLNDSTETEQGLKYSYRSIYSGTLNSLEKNEFQFISTRIKKLKIKIQNYDNESLSFSSVDIQGYEHDLVIRFSGEARYHLMYGNRNASAPQYDIAKFQQNIPATLTTLELSDEEEIKKLESTLADPLFENKLWLWSAMILTIGLLGWFSIKMMKKN